MAIARRRIARPDVADDLNQAFLASGGDTLNPSQFADELIPVFLFPPPTQAMRRLTLEQQNGGVGTVLLSSTATPADRYRWAHVVSAQISAVGTATVLTISLAQVSSGVAAGIAATTTMIAGNVLAMPRSILVPSGFRLDFELISGNAASQLSFRFMFIEYKLADPHPFL